MIEELGQMRDYYQDPFSVIAASTGEAATDGFLNIKADAAATDGPHEYSLSRRPQSVEVPFLGKNNEIGMVILEAGSTLHRP
jgi:hypothetical protein